MSDPVERYVRSLRDIRGSGAAVKETSYYGTLEALLNEIGGKLSPKVRCIVQVRNSGAGLPDGGLFTADQLRDTAVDRPTLQDVPVPARGVVEAKGTDEDVRKTAQTEQVQRYLTRYNQVLLTNYRDFLLVEKGDDGRPVLGEHFSLAPDERAFWAATIEPRSFANEQGDRFAEFLRRMLLHAAPLTAPKDVAYFLASYARDAKVRIERSGLPRLVAVRQALEQALGLRFEGERGDHFFRSTFVQTLFYGLFSAWVIWCKRQPAAGERFDWKDTGFLLRVPALGALFEQIATRSNLESLGLIETLDWAGAALNRVVRSSFFTLFEEAHAVQYFYEPFLEAFDPELRKQLGVWYTPPEVVEYMVARVDAALREELGIEAGLADPRVHVLDPCTGTGSYLVEVLRRIHRTLEARGSDALLASDLKRAAMERLRGFEILPAPFVVAHLQMGLLLQNLGAPLAEDGRERVGIYLTNALTGWEQSPAAKQIPFLPELAEERDAAEQVKREERILVVLGNPPYNGYAGVAVTEERALSDAYRVAQRTKQPQGQGLNDLYVRFYRMAERRIVEQTGEGIVCFISNYSWLDGLSFTAMRERFLEVFDGIRIDSLNGDKYKTGKLTPAGEPDPSIFSTDRNREGIQVGTAIALAVRQRRHAPTEQVRFRHLWGKGKLAQLRQDADLPSDKLAYQDVVPANYLGLPLLPMGTNAGYLRWPALPALFPTSFPGVKTSRDDVVVDIDRDRLVERMERYFDPAVSNEDLRRTVPGAMEDSGRFAAESVRARLLKRGFLSEKVVRYHYRPFDLRWLYWEPDADLLDRKREDYAAQIVPRNRWISAGQRNRKEAFYQPQFTTLLADHHIVESNVAMFPLYVRPVDGKVRLSANPATGEPTPNLSDAAARHMASLSSEAEDLFYHALAVLHAPAYRSENAGALRQDWPRLPVPASRETLAASAELGRQVAALLDAESPVRGVNAGVIRPELRAIAAITSFGGHHLNPNADDLALTVGWGHPGQGRVVMPGRGKLVARDYSASERAAIAAAVDPLGLATEDERNPLGRITYDVYLNERAYWSNVPERVWSYTMGGYQVLKKWLSYREADLLGRSLTSDEVREVTYIARRIAAILLLQPKLDANYHAAAASAYDWPVASAATALSLPWGDA